MEITSVKNVLLITKPKPNTHGLNINPVAYRWRRSPNSEWQLSRRIPRPIMKMGNFHKALKTEVDPLYDSSLIDYIIELECTVRFMCDRIRKHADSNPEILSAFQHGEDILARDCSEQV